VTGTTSDTYRTVDGRGEAAFERQKSRFLGIVESASTVEAVETLLERVREDHPDATHVVPAYRVRVEDGDFLREYSSDDGEPSGSAGPPALNVLQGESLENVAVCVVRHYGGTNLGVGGLVSAYGESVKRAIADAGTTTTRPKTRFTVTVDYDDSGTVRSVLESADATFEADYDERVRFAVVAPRHLTDTLHDRLRSATRDRVVIEEPSG
jgi:uncharacterized YigZ family protein